MAPEKINPPHQDNKWSDSLSGPPINDQKLVKLEADIQGLMGTIFKPSFQILLELKWNYVLRRRKYILTPLSNDLYKHSKVTQL